MSRSAELTKGCRWKILGLSIVVWVPVMIAMFTVAYMMSDKHETVLFSFVQNLVLFIPSAFMHVTTAVIYYELRKAKEGVAIDSLANVFD